MTESAKEKFAHYVSRRQVEGLDDAQILRSLGNEISTFDTNRAEIEGSVARRPIDKIKSISVLVDEMNQSVGGARGATQQLNQKRARTETFRASEGDEN